MCAEPPSCRARSPAWSTPSGTLRMRVQPDGRPVTERVDIDARWPSIAVIDGSDAPRLDRDWTGAPTGRPGAGAAGGRGAGRLRSDSGPGRAQRRRRSGGPARCRGAGIISADGGPTAGVASGCRDPSDRSSGRGSRPLRRGSSWAASKSSSRTRRPHRVRRRAGSVWVRRWRCCTPRLRSSRPSSRCGSPHPDRTTTPGPAVVHYDELGTLAVLADAIEADGSPIPDVLALDQVAARAPWILQTLHDVATHASLRAAAQAGHVHHSTLQQRLGRAEQLLGWSLSEPQGRLRLQLALVARRLQRNA